MARPTACAAGVAVANRLGSAGRDRVRRAPLKAHGFVGFYCHAKGFDIYILDEELTTWQERVAKRMLLECARTDGDVAVALLSESELPAQPALV
jgi:hypothetical protein